MIRPRENLRVPCIVPGRTFDLEGMGARSKPSCSLGGTRPDHSDGSGWSSEPGYRLPVADLPAHGPIVASEVPGPATARLGEGRPSSGAHPKDFGTEGSCGGRSHAPHEAPGGDPLEHPDLGEGARLEPSHDPSNLETAQPQTPLGPDLQAQPGQAVYRKAGRCGGPVSESSGQIPDPLGRREKPDPGSRPDSAGPSPQKRSLRYEDPRLQTPWHHHPVRGPEHAGRQGDWRLPAASSPPRVHPLPQE